MAGKPGSTIPGSQIEERQKGRKIHRRGDSGEGRAREQQLDSVVVASQHMQVFNGYDASLSLIVK
jgi:hypothetical protein